MEQRIQSLQGEASIPGYYELGTTILSENDTIKYDQYASISNSVIWDMADGSTVTHTRSGKTLTITQAITNKRVLVLVWGPK